jgi:hypothetical protein
MCYGFCFVYLRLLRPMLPVSLDCPFLIASSVFSDVVFCKIISSKIIVNDNVIT